MKVVFKANIKNLGQIGDIKEVKSGFARNYLFPNDLALPVDTLEAEKILENLNHKHEKKQLEIEGITEKVKDIEKFIFTRKASKNGKLYGGVSQKDLIEAVEQKTGFRPESLVGDFPIKELGEKKVTLIFSGGKEIEVTVFTETEVG